MVEPVTFRLNAAEKFMMSGSGTVRSAAFNDLTVTVAPAASWPAPKATSSPLSPCTMPPSLPSATVPACGITTRTGTTCSADL